MGITGSNMAYEWYPEFVEWWKQNVKTAEDARYGQAYYQQLIQRDQQREVEDKAKSERNRSNLALVAGTVAAPVAYMAGTKLGGLLGLGKAAATEAAISAVPTASSAGAAPLIIPTPLGAEAASWGGGFGVGGGGGGGAASAAPSFGTVAGPLAAYATAPLWAPKLAEAGSKLTSWATGRTEPTRGQTSTTEDLIKRQREDPSTSRFLDAQLPGYVAMDDGERSKILEAAKLAKVLGVPGEIGGNDPDYIIDPVRRSETRSKISRGIDPNEGSAFRWGSLQSNKADPLFTREAVENSRTLSDKYKQGLFAFLDLVNGVPGVPGAPTGTTPIFANDLVLRLPPGGGY